MDEALTFARLLAVVAEQSGMSVEALRGRAEMGGRADANRPRHRLLMLARRLLPATSWRGLQRQMNGRTIRNLCQQASRGEARYASCPLERKEVARVLSALGIDALPAYDERQWRRARLDREIAQAETRLAALRAERAQLGEPA